MGNPVYPNLASGNTSPRPAKTSVAAGQTCHMGEEITVTAAQLTLNALFGSVKVPKGAVIVGVGLKSTDIDTNGSPAVILAVGDVTVADRLITGSTIGQAGGFSSALDKAGYAFQYTAETLVQIKVTTAPATAAAGTFTYHVTYIVP